MIKLKREIIDHGFDASGNLFVAKVDDDNHEWGRENDRRDDDGDTQSVSGGHKEVSISLMNVETLAVMATLCFEVSEALYAFRNALSFSRLMHPHASCDVEWRSSRISIV